jgi:DNA-binding MarR family transcriptional regulator
LVQIASYKLAVGRHLMNELRIEDTLRQVSLSTLDLAAAARILQKLLPFTAETRSVRGLGAIEVALGMYSARRDRRHYLPMELFSDPTWDMLLYLYCMDAQGELVPISSLCAASLVPQTSALRWISALERHGLLERCAHPTDRRSVVAKLTPESRTKLMAYFERVGKLGTYSAGGLTVVKE